MAVTVEDSYHSLPASVTAITRRADSVKMLRSRTRPRLHSGEIILEGLLQDLQDRDHHQAAAREETRDRLSPPL